LYGKTGSADMAVIVAFAEAARPRAPRPRPKNKIAFTERDVFNADFGKVLPSLVTALTGDKNTEKRTISAHYFDLFENGHEKTPQTKNLRRKQ